MVHSILQPVRPDVNIWDLSGMPEQGYRRPTALSRGKIDRARLGHSREGRGGSCRDAPSGPNGDTHDQQQVGREWAVREGRGQAWPTASRHI